VNQRATFAESLVRNSAPRGFAITSTICGLGQVLDRGGEEKDDHSDSRGRDKAGDLAAGAHVVVHGGARAAGADREALREAGRGVRGPHRQQLL
jgi:hypothetical protein